MSELSAHEAHLKLFRDQISSLKQEVKRLKKQTKDCAYIHERDGKDIESLRSALSDAVDALENLGKHSVHCLEYLGNPRIIKTPETACICGLNDTLSRLKERLKR